MPITIMKLNSGMTPINLRRKPDVCISPEINKTIDPSPQQVSKKETIIVNLKRNKKLRKSYVSSS